ncbi:MAG: 3-deoxy-D-manno-octulosonic acid transferase [Cryomorphaceae bacterium]|nr:3-deoxy-D-manno-octulosonic acid transferase [Cryomorphaceae bacterium]MBT3503241.1 3-deoxy-D-manno-octulosonic acid transferase [Cryomorphaceae bacterium]MBT3689163.1 3-deoxy-D-manno-octulosonic acid transferase [Cryomorphaceae bacterium]MBT4293776.1 3-deoxy-D-manno-octulosonic acid transferase [Cryomorphaceae bacterium]MBT6547044.1 3-deoxy-D-manno-octulosonic acid transferase [Cryomorphaceae bacterium]
MKFIYEIFIILAYLLSQPFRVFSSKTNLFFKGRKDSFKILRKEVSPSDKNIWFHVASLGEFEIAKPIIESLKSNVADIKIIVTFFSPSGLENSKDYTIADSMVYLPLDLSLNAKKFVKIVNPKVAVFIKNDIWSNYLTYLKQNNSLIYSVSSKFDESQFYFKFYGNWFLKKLKNIDFFYIQDFNSESILKKYSLKNINISGDSRFTSVIKTLEENNQINYIEKFIDNQKCLIAGSVWEKDISIIDKVVQKNNIKSIIAPHNISSNFIKKLENLYGDKAVKYSCLKSEGDFDKKILIIDSIGSLKYIYKYGHVSYIGGGMSNNGLHNILEPAVFSCPVIIGQNYKGFSEAEQLLELGGVYSVKNPDEFSKVFSLLDDIDLRNKSGKINFDYILKNVEKNSKIINSLIKNLQ